METTFSDVLKMSPPLAMGAVLFVLGAILKRSPLPDWTVPLVLSAIGGVAFPFLIPASQVGFECPHPEALLAVYGALIGLAPTGLHQAFKQFGKDKPDKPMPPDRISSEKD